MLPRVSPRPVAAAPARLARALLLALGLCGCGGEDEAPAAARLPPRAGAVRQGQADAARALVDALVAEPSPERLLAALAQGHGTARELLGPHTLRHTTDFKLAPVEPARPVVDQPVLLDQAVRDELLLEWGTRPGEPVQFHLSQSNDKHRGRELLVLDEQIYTRLPHRGWHVRPLDAELHWRWLDEAQRGVHDLVEFAAPRLAVEVREQGELVEVGLALAPAADPARVAGGIGREWRQRAELTAIEGAITIQRATGLWQSAELRVSYTLKDALDRTLRGETHLTGRVELAPELRLRAPEQAQPLPERVRYEALRRRLLDGLAGT